MSKSRSYCFTINNYQEDDIIDCWGLFYDHNAKYTVWGYEVGEEGTPHIQGYVRFAEARHFTAVKKMIPKAHIEVQKGSNDQAIDYCLKECSEFIELGERPHMGSASWDKIEDAMANPTANPHTYNQYRKIYREITNKKKTVPKFYAMHIDRFEPREYNICTSIDTYQLDDDILVCEQPEMVHWKTEYASILQQFKRYKQYRIKRGYEILNLNVKYIIFLYHTKDDQTIEFLHENKISILQNIDEIIFGDTKTSQDLQGDAEISTSIEAD